MPNRSCLVSIFDPRRRITVILLLALSSCGQPPEPVVNGELKLWHKVTLTFDGPKTGEDADPNPFRDYRLNVTFTHAASGSSYTARGYFAADGNAGETSAKTGNKWRAHFAPDQEGECGYDLDRYRLPRSIPLELRAARAGLDGR